VGWLLSLLLYWGSCLATGGGLFRFHIPTAVNLSYGHSRWFLGASPIRYSPHCHPFLVFHSFLWPSDHLACLSPQLILNLPPPHSPTHPFSHSVLSLHLPPTTILFPLLSEIQASSLGPSFFGFVACSMSILNFMATIYPLKSEDIPCMSFGDCVSLLWMIFLSTICLKNSWCLCF
jgi:hypothetical protein